MQRAVSVVEDGQKLRGTKLGDLGEGFEQEKKRLWPGCVCCMLEVLFGFST